MEHIDFLNLEYFLLRVYSLFSGVDVDSYASTTVETVSTLWLGITALGLVCALLLLIALVWAWIRLAAVEHKHHERHAGHAAHAHEEHVEEMTRWEIIMMLAASANESERRRAILEADAMLSEVLEERGYLGESVGEKLRNANPLQFTTLDLAWKAHKVRNDIAHNHSLELSERDVRATIDYYRRVFEEFGII